MLISLGLASSRNEVKEEFDKIDTNGNGELDFDEYLELFKRRKDSQMSTMFKLMMDGKLGDRNLNFQTVISQYRRQLVLDASGARTNRQLHLHSDYQELPKDHSVQVTANFAHLQRSRFLEASTDADKRAISTDPDVMTWELPGGVPPGSLGKLWRSVARERNLLPQPSVERKESLGCPGR
jgi:hypothetical protein